MNAKRKSTLVLLGLAALLLAVTSGTAWADAAGYSPASKTVSGTQPFSSNFDLTITSPAKLTGGNPPPPFPAGGVDIKLGVSVDDKPVGVADSTALDMLTLNSTETGASCASVVPGSGTCTLHFTAFSEGRRVNVAIDVSSSATPGDYQFTIKTDAGGSVPGWGNGDGTVLNVSISEPGVTDTTAPIVVITSPVDGSTLTYCSDGTPVSVVFNAQDPESVITSVSADINGSPVVLSTVTGLNTKNVDASGTKTLNSIGGFTVNAHATNTVPLTGDASVGVSVSFNIVWLPPLSLGKTSKGGSTVPVKFSARDCNGNFVHNESVKVVVLEVTAGGDVQALSGLFGDGASSVRIDDVAGQYIINFQTASGAHNYRVDVYFNDFNNQPFKQGSKTFSVR